MFCAVVMYVFILHNWLKNTYLYSMSSYTNWSPNCYGQIYYFYEWNINLLSTHILSVNSENLLCGCFHLVEQILIIEFDPGCLGFDWVLHHLRKKRKDWNYHTNQATNILYYYMKTSLADLGFFRYGSGYAFLSKVE